MDNPLATSLIVTGFGMLMLFLALTLLHGLIYLMTGLIKERTVIEGSGIRDQGAGGRDQGPGEEKPETEGEKRRVAAIGLALARAERELGAGSVPGREESPSTWRAFHQQRQLTLTLRPRRSR